MTYSNVTRIDGGDSFLYSTKCNNGDYFAVTYSYAESRRWRKFFNNLKPEKDYIFEVEFIGKPQTSIVPTFGHLGWTRAQMEITEITSIKDITALPNTIKPDYEAQTPLKSRGSSLQTINSDILFYFIFGDKSSSSQNVERYISDDFTLIDKFGRKFDKNNYWKLIKEGLFNQVKESIGVENGRVEKLKDGNYVVSGKIKNTINGIKKESINYEDTFRFSEENGWMLTKIKFLKIKI